MISRSIPKLCLVAVLSGAAPVASFATPRSGATRPPPPTVPAAQSTAGRTASAGGEARHFNLSADGLALSGYDPVSYFTQTKPLKGKPNLTLSHRGATYRFASEGSRELFQKTPEKFLPAYGGWCATAMAHGEKVEIDPTNYKVTQGRLFLFFRAFYANALKEWNKDEVALTAKADGLWRRITAE